MCLIVCLCLFKLCGFGGVLVVVCFFWCACIGLPLTVCRFVFVEYVFDCLFVLV